MTTSRNRAIVLAITEGGMPITDAAAKFGITPRWTRELLHRYERDGLAGLEPRSRRPRSNPAATPDPIRADILRLRDELVRAGLDAGAESIHARLPTPTRPSVSTIWRILRAAGTVTPQPQKRPRSSWHRFQAASPNALWQSDFTHIRLATGDHAEVISWLDDHSRYLLSCTAHPRVTGPIVVDTFLATADEHGLPAATLTDNGMVYTTRLAAGARGRNPQPNGFEQLLADLGIEQRNGRPNRPTTQGKVERLQQTLKQWLTARAVPPGIEQLQALLHELQRVYNTERPHRALDRATPAAVYRAAPKDAPRFHAAGQQWRVRVDTVDDGGLVTLRYAGRLRHLGIGRAWKRRRVIVLANGPDVMVIARGSGEIIAEFTIDPGKNYQPQQRAEPER